MCDPTPAQRRILRHLRKHDGRRIGFVDLATLTKTSYGTIREHILKMEASGLIARELGRHRSLRITRRGLEALERNPK